MMKKINAKAYFRDDNPNGINGVVYFDELYRGTMVTAHIRGLPPFSRNGRIIGPHGFHIYVNGECTQGKPDNTHLNTGGHYNLERRFNGNYAGDFPVLFSGNGDVKARFFTDKFYPKDVIGRSVVIHELPDDYETGLSVNSAKKLACAQIIKY